MPELPRYDCGRWGGTKASTDQHTCTRALMNFIFRSRFRSPYPGKFARMVSVTLLPVHNDHQMRKSVNMWKCSYLSTPSHALPWNVDLVSLCVVRLLYGHKRVDIHKQALCSKLQLGGSFAISHYQQSDFTTLSRFAIINIPPGWLTTIKDASIGSPTGRLFSLFVTTNTPTRRVHKKIPAILVRLEGSWVHLTSQTFRL